MVIATQQHAEGSEIDARIVERGREKGTRIEAQVELLPSFFSNFQLRKKKEKRKKIEKKKGGSHSLLLSAAALAATDPTTTAACCSS